MMNESLMAGDLRLLVDNIFEIDSFKSKMGSDTDICVLSFTVNDAEPAKDLVEFIEKGYEFVLDADASPGELADGKYKVFVEIERNRRIAEQIVDILEGITNLTEVKNWKFRYFKSFHSVDANEENLKETIPCNKNDYEISVQENYMNNFSNFFNRSYLESVSVDNDDIVFQRKFSGPLRMRIKEFGPVHQIYDKIKGPMMIESKDMSEIMFYTKCLGNYNITKIGASFVFENNGYAVVLERK